MRFRLAQAFIFGTVCLFAGTTQIQAQAFTPAVGGEKSCPPSAAASAKEPSGPEISVVGVTFSGFLRLPVSDQDEIATSIREQAHGTGSLGELKELASEIVRGGWQNHGYFKVLVNVDATTLSVSPASQRIALGIYVDEGLQYGLGGIMFTHNRAVSNGALRALFPIEDNDIFSREKIRTGLENLSKAYGEMGYINFTSIPNTTFDDEKKLIYLDIDLDEEKQFYVGDISILGVDDAARAQMLQAFLLQPGQIYNQRLVGLSMLKHGSEPPGCECGDRPSLWLDEKTGTVRITFDFRPCPGGQ
jgi:Surface antigen variable number repeat